METKNKELGIYIHIPFCVKKCYYCDFTSFAGCEHLQERYIECLKKEVKYKLKQIKDNYNITTIYIGGGTPSVIDSGYIKEIMELIEALMNEKSNEDGCYVSDKDKSKVYRKQNFFKEVEATIEVNPGTVTLEKLQEYKRVGINRLSIGLQSTNNKLLKEIGRIHSFEQFKKTYSLAKKVGYENINLDLMIGLPNQTIEDLKQGLEEVLRLNTEHISVYSLIIEEGTELYNLVNKGELELPDEELERQMYWYVKNTLELNDYKHYEISNFAKMGYESKHNVNCWKQKEYVGIGLGASSYINSVRYSNIRNLKDYMSNIEAEKYEENKNIEEMQTEIDKQKEFMMLGLRRLDGISIQEFKLKFGTNPLYIYKEELDRLTQKGLIKVDGDKIKLTNKGLDLANYVWMEFI